MGKEEFVKDLRDLADYLETHNFELDKGDCLWGNGHIYLSCDKIPSFKKNIKAMGPFEKAAGDDLEANKRFGSFTFQVYIARNKVCKRVVTGKRIIPAKPAEPEREEEIVKYECPKSFYDIQENTEELVK